MEKTITQFGEITKESSLFVRGHVGHYSTALKILSAESITEMLYTISFRAREIEEQKTSGDYVLQFHQLINYSVLALIKTEFSDALCKTMLQEKLMNYHRLHLKEANELMLNKNHDYGEAWRHMRISSMTDLILMKIIRVKQIQSNNGQTIISEGLPANFYDIINYAFFALIRINEEQGTKPA